MPGVYQPSSVGSILQMMLTRVRALETQQQMTLSNNAGLPVMNFGLIPGSSPPAYGIQFLDPGTGEQRLLVGTLPDGTYGISYTDPLSNTSYLLPQYSSFCSLNLPIISVSPVLQTGAGTPDVTAWIGPSGDAYVTVSSILSSSSTNQALLYVTVDGTIPANYALTLGGTAGAAATCATTILLSELNSGHTVTPNAAHTFQIAIASSSASDSSDFTFTSLTIEPT